MAYKYENEKPKLFTDEGQRLFLKIRDRANALIKNSGAATMGSIIEMPGDNWEKMACVDRMVELGELREVNQGGYVPGQDRIFV